MKNCYCLIAFRGGSSGSRTGYPAAISNRSRHAMIHAFKVQRRQSIQCPRVLVTGPVQFTLVQLGAIGLWSALMSAASPASLNRLKPDCRSSQVKGTFGVATRCRFAAPWTCEPPRPLRAGATGRPGACPPPRAAPPSPQRTSPDAAPHSFRRSHYLTARFGRS